MSFKFNVETTDEIKSAKVYLLEGVIEEGNILIGSEAKAIVNGKDLWIKVKGVVLINRSRKAELEKKMTLTIEMPSFDMKELEGQALLG